MLAAALYHLFEQSILHFHRDVLLSQEERDRHGLFSLRECFNRLHAQGINCQQFAIWPKIAELGLVANTAKHADGRSSTELKTLRPDILGNTQGPVYVPMAGQGLYVLQGDLDVYFEAVLSFFAALADELSAPDRP